MNRKRPLAGKIVVLTRPWADAQPMMHALTDRGAGVVSFPTIEIAPLSIASDFDESAYDWFVFTSANGVRLFEKALQEKDRALSSLGGIRVCAVGPATAEAAREFGLDVALTPEKFQADEIPTAFEQSVGSLEGQRILLPRGNLAGGPLAGSLQSLGASVDEVTVYETRCPEVSPAECDALLRNEPHAVVFTSASCAKNFCTLLGPERLDNLSALYAAIGPQTTAALNATPLRPIHQADPHTTEGLVAVIEAHLARE